MPKSIPAEEARWATRRACGPGRIEPALVGFRTTLRGCLLRWGDALFELADAALDGPASVGSVPALSLEPVFRRSHGSLYKALARGRIDERALRDLLAAVRPAGWPAVFAVDATTWPRCDAETSPERGFYYQPSRHSAGQPIVAGWSYSWIAGLSWARGFVDGAARRPAHPARHRPGCRHARPTDRARGAPGGHGSRAAVRVRRRLRPDRTRARPGGDPGGHPRAHPVRPVVPRAAGPRRTVGRPRRHGRRFACADPASWWAPDATLGLPTPATAGSRSPLGTASTPSSPAAVTGPARCRRSSRAASSGWRSSTCPSRPRRA